MVVKSVKKKQFFPIGGVETSSHPTGHGPTRLSHPRCTQSSWRVDFGMFGGDDGGCLAPSTRLNSPCSVAHVSIEIPEPLAGCLPLHGSGGAPAEWGNLGLEKRRPRTRHPTRIKLMLVMPQIRQHAKLAQSLSLKLLLMVMEQGPQWETSTAGKHHPTRNGWNVSPSVTRYVNDLD